MIPSQKRTHSLPLLAGLLFATVVAAGCANCSSCNERGALGLPAYCGYGSGPPCFGFTSTCWRPWPEECPNCPPYTLNALPPEALPPDNPQPLPANGGRNLVPPMPPVER